MKNLDPRSAGGDLVEFHPVGTRGTIDDQRHVESQCRLHLVTDQCHQRWEFVLGHLELDHGAVVLLRDISERKREEEERIQLEQKVAQRQPMSWWPPSVKLCSRMNTP